MSLQDAHTKSASTTEADDNVSVTPYKMHTQTQLLQLKQMITFL